MLLDGELELNVALFELYEKKNKKKQKTMVYYLNLHVR